MRPLRLLTFSSLYPNAAQPNHGIFVENRLRHLVASGEVSSTVVAPVPWFPSADPRFGRWAQHARVPAEEVRHGLRVLHPRFPGDPPHRHERGPVAALSRHAAGARAPAGRRAGVRRDRRALPLSRRRRRGLLGRRFGLPVVVTARGTDVNLIPRYRLPRRLIRAAIDGASAVVTVSGALRDALLDLGAPPGKVTVLRNGVDTALFRPPEDRAAARATFGVAGPTLVSVGGLIERKGHHRTIAALASLPGTTLLIAGEGPERPHLEALIARLGLGDRVRLLGAVPHRDLPALYGAADASVLASSREGWANVLLESMACGTPVVASPIWGNPEVVRVPAAGLIAPENTPEALAATIRRLLASPPAREATRAYAEGMSWDETTAGQLALFRRVVGAEGFTTEGTERHGGPREPGRSVVRGL